MDELPFFEKSTASGFSSTNGVLRPRGGLFGCHPGRCNGECDEQAVGSYCVRRGTYNTVELEVMLVTTPGPYYLEPLRECVAFSVLVADHSVVAVLKLRNGQGKYCKHLC